jgi:RNA polymerase sigma-70 factor (ECF subfamily)
LALSPHDISELYTRHSKELLRYFARRTFDQQVSLDLVGETFASALENREQFRGRSESERKSWLYGIAHHLLNLYFRDGGIERRAMERMQLSRVEPNANDIEQIEELAELDSLRTEIVAALDQLPQHDRDAIQLRVIEQRDYQSVAAELGTSEQVARARVSRALQRVRALIEQARIEEVARRA